MVRLVEPAPEDRDLVPGSMPHVVDAGADEVGQGSLNKGRKILEAGRGQEPDFSSAEPRIEERACEEDGPDLGEVQEQDPRPPAGDAGKGSSRPAALSQRSQEADHDDGEERHLDLRSEVCCARFAAIQASGSDFRSAERFASLIPSAILIKLS
tara:strand:+ start:97 stop:558 length:462 start_codon:yes stop_codon:yes gene_type:complete